MLHQNPEIPALLDWHASLKPIDWDNSWVFDMRILIQIWDTTWLRSGFGRVFGLMIPCSRFWGNLSQWFMTFLFSLHHTIPLHYITLHYITLHYSTLHTYTHTYIHTSMHALHYITLHYTTLHYITLHYTTLHYITYTTYTTYTTYIP